MVVLYHMTGHNQIWQMWGYGLVVLFMTMSGFLLTSLWLQRRYEADHHPARTFVRRRVFRVVPTNTIYTVAPRRPAPRSCSSSPRPTPPLTSPGGALDQGEQVEIVGGDGEGCRETDATPVVAAATNLVFVLNFFQADGMCGSVFSHLWTVNIEFQFYLLLPLFMLGLWRVAKRDPVKVGLIVTGVGSLLVWANRLRLDYSTDSAFQMAYFRTDMRFDAIFVGIFAALAAATDGGSPDGPGPGASPRPCCSSSAGSVAPACSRAACSTGSAWTASTSTWNWASGSSGRRSRSPSRAPASSIWVAARPPGAKTPHPRAALGPVVGGALVLAVRHPSAVRRAVVAHRRERGAATTGIERSPSILGTAAAIVAAWLLHIFLEQPFMRRGAGKDWDVPIVSPWLEKRRGGEGRGPGSVPRSGRSGARRTGAITSRS